MAGFEGLIWFVYDTSSERLAGMWPTTKGKVFGAFGKRATHRKRALASEGETVVLVSPQTLDQPVDRGLLITTNCAWLAFGALRRGECFCAC